jgi:hypothetical protein
METACEVPLDKAKARPRRPRGGSRTRHGKMRLPNRAQLDGRTATAKAFDKLAADIASDLGGYSELTAVERALIEGFCGAAVVLQALNTRLALGEAIELSEHAAVCSSLVRIAAKIGLSRRSRVVSGIVEDTSSWSPMRASLSRAAEIGRAADRCDEFEGESVDAEEVSP